MESNSEQQKPDFEKEADKYISDKSNLNYFIKDNARNGFLSGADFGYHSRDKEVEELKAWKESEMKIWLPIIDFMQDDKSMRVGESISKEVLKRIQEYNDLKAENEKQIKANQLLASENVRLTGVIESLKAENEKLRKAKVQVNELYANYLQKYIDTNRELESLKKEIERLKG